MKKSISIVLIITVIALCFLGSFNTLAVNTAKISLSTPKKLYSYNKTEKNVTPTKYFDVTFKLTNNTGIAGIEFDLVFDNSLLVIKKVTNGKILTDCYYNNENAASPCKFLIYNGDTSQTSSEGTLVTINFGVRSSVKKADLKFELKNIVAYDENTNAVDISCASVTKQWCSHKSQNWEYVMDKNGNYSGEAEYRCNTCNMVFETQQVSLPKLSEVNWEIPTCFYTGKTITPNIKGTYFSKSFNRTLVLEKDVNYKVLSIENNKNSGTAYVNLSSDGCYGYKGVKNKLKFKIVKPSVKLSYNSTEYNSKAKKPTVTVKVGKSTLISGTDYTLTYKNNKNPSKATVTVKGKGKYQGSYKAYFVINPKAPTLKTYKSTSKKKLTVSVEKSSLVSGYQFQIATNSKFTLGKKEYISNSNNTFKTTFSSLKSKKYYYVRVRSYKTVGTEKYYGKWCSVKKVLVK